MDISEIQNQLDKLYSHSQLDEAYHFLLEQTSLAMKTGDDLLVLMLLNELIGYYRVTAKFQEGNTIVDQAVKILISRGLDQTIHGATTYINIATFYRVQGRYQEALSFYLQTKAIYEKLLDKNDERYSAFYNNMSLLYQEMGDYQKAINYEYLALAIISKLENCEIEQAITYTNLSQMYFVNREMEKGKECLKKAIQLFKQYGPQDPHYFAALSSLAQSHYLEKNYQQAILIYDDVLNGIEKVYGRNKDYQTVLMNKRKVEQDMNNQTPKGLDICQKYYETYGKKMIEEKFADYQKYMAIGLFGFGSDCLGYDDDISHDHDFGPGFCIWLPRDIYWRIGHSLQNEYDHLPQEFMGMKRVETSHGQGRVGVFVIEDFFNQFLGKIPKTLEDWLYIDENGLLACTNGRIFEDYYGQVTQIRKDLSYYPEDVRLKKIVRAIAKMAQAGQYNYSRCMTRHNQVAASLALHEFIDQTLSAVYLLNKKYKPYYKWSFYGLKDCPILNDVAVFIEQLVTLPTDLTYWQELTQTLNTEDPKVVIIEKICQKVIMELNKQGLTDHFADFLDNHTMNVMSLIEDETIKNKHIMEG